VGARKIAEPMDAPNTAIASLFHSWSHLARCRWSWSLRLALVAPGEFLADLGGQHVVFGAFDEQPARMTVAAAGDMSQALERAAGVFPR
jgi:hypothetical protein